MQPGDSSDQLFEFKLDTTRRAFDSLVDFFIEDYMVKKYVAEKSGWRTIAEIAQRSHLSPSALYGKHSTIGPVLDEPIRRGLVESRIFPGERGRGGEVMRLRIAYDKEPIREYVNRKVRTGGKLTEKEPGEMSQKSNAQASQVVIESERKLAAVMLTDIVGYTALTQRDESLALKLLAKHKELVRAVLAKHRGKEIKTMGDSFLVEFESALEATNCAVNLQQVLHEYNLEAKNEMLVRIGIHAGDVVREAGDIFGDTVNIASRVMSAAKGSEICISEQVYAQVRNKVPFRMINISSPELKNISFPIEVFKLELPWEEKEQREYDRHRLAVLPFANFSPDPNDEYFSDGMTEELISTMSKISGLKVIARTSVMSYKREHQKKIDEIARELKVGTILEGSVRKASDMLRITVQLIDSNTSEHVWSESYDRELKDIFAIQSGISETVADALKIRLLPSEKALIEKQPTRSTEAPHNVLEGDVLQCQCVF